MRDRQVGRDSAGDGAQQEPHGEQGELDDRLMLEQQGVREGEDEVGEDDAGQGGPNRQGQAQRGCRQDCGGGPGDRGREVPGRDRSVALGRVRTIGVDISGVVDEVGGA